MLIKSEGMEKDIILTLIKEKIRIADKLLSYRANFRTREIGT